MGTYLEQPTVDKLLTPLMVIVNQYQLDTIKYRRSELAEERDKTECEFLAIRNNFHKVNPANIVGVDPDCKITPRELTDSVQNALTLLLHATCGSAEYTGALEFKMTVNPRKVSIQYELSNGHIVKTTYSRNLTH